MLYLKKNFKENRIEIIRKLVLLIDEKQDFEVFFLWKFIFIKSNIILGDFEFILDFD